MSLSAFLAENALPAAHIKYAVSSRFLSEKIDPETGKRKPMEWEIRTISGTEDEALRKTCVQQVPVPGRKHFSGKLIMISTLGSWR